MQTNKEINVKEEISKDTSINDDLSSAYQLLSNEEIGIQFHKEAGIEHYKEIEKIYMDNTPVLKMANEKTGYTFCHIFVFFIF